MTPADNARKKKRARPPVAEPELEASVSPARGSKRSKVNKSLSRRTKSTSPSAGGTAISSEKSKNANSSPKSTKASSLANSKNANSLPKSKKASTLANSKKAKSLANSKNTKSPPASDTEVETSPRKKSKRRTREQKDQEEMPLAARTPGLRMFVGAHVSCAKGVQNSVSNAVHIGGNAFAMFLKSQRKWQNPPLQDDHRERFRQLCDQHRFNAQRHVLPHGSYLVNLAQAETAKAQQAYEAFLDDLQRCDALGIQLYNFHPGSTGSAPRPAAIKRIADQLNRAVAATTTVIPVLEAMAGAGNVIGSTFEDLRDIIALVTDKQRVGVCIDTCHIFAAGYDIRDAKGLNDVLVEFDRIVGIRYLRALHLNDSKAPLGSHRDLHQNIGLGFLGLRAFHAVMNEKRFEDLPMVLETPTEHKNKAGKEVEDKGIWAREIKLLESLMEMDVETKGFKMLEEELAAKGAEERAKHQEAFERKQGKTEKKQAKLSFGKKDS